MDQKTIQISELLITKILNYLATKPYNEVVEMLNMFIQEQKDNQLYKQLDTQNTNEEVAK